MKYVLSFVLLLLMFIDQYCSHQAGNAVQIIGSSYYLTEQLSLFVNRLIFTHERDCYTNSERVAKKAFQPLKKKAEDFQILAFIFSTIFLSFQ